MPSVICIDPRICRFNNVVTIQFHSLLHSEHLINNNMEHVKKQSILYWVAILEVTMELIGWTKWTTVLLITARQHEVCSEGNVVSQMSVHHDLSVCPWDRGLLWPLPMMLWSSLYRTLYLQPQPPLCQPWPLGHGPHCTGILPSASDSLGGHHGDPYHCETLHWCWYLVAIEAHKVGTI